MKLFKFFSQFLGIFSASRCTVEVKKAAVLVGTSYEQMVLLDYTEIITGWIHILHLRRRAWLDHLGRF